MPLPMRHVPIQLLLPSCVLLLSAGTLLSARLNALLALDRFHPVLLQPWRAFTHPLVHFSLQHWVLDAATFLGVLATVARFTPGTLPALAPRALAAAVAAGILSFVLDPDLQRLGGLSGFNLALASGLAFRFLESHRWKAGLGILAGLAIKLLGEASGLPFPGLAHSGPVHTCSIVHQISVLLMTVLTAVTGWQRRRSVPARNRTCPGESPPNPCTRGPRPIEPHTA